MTFSPRSRETLRCGSWLVYATRATSTHARRAVSLVIAIKQDRIDPATKRSYADQTAETLARSLEPPLTLVLTPQVVLVPVPGRGLTQPHSVWATRALCEAMVAHGIGSAVWPVVERIKAVRKSAGSTVRPSADEHADSFRVTIPLRLLPERFVLVDDVVTRGCTLLGAARRLREAFPGIAVDGFALARVQSSGEIASVTAPTVEALWTYGNDCWRAAALPG